MNKDKKALKKIEGQLKGSAKMHGKQAKKINKIAGKYMNKKNCGCKH